MSFTWVAFWQICTWGGGGRVFTAWELSQTVAQDHQPPRGEKAKGIPEKKILVKELMCLDDGQQWLKVFYNQSQSLCYLWLNRFWGAILWYMQSRLCITQNVWIWTIFFSKLMCKNLSLALAGFWANGASLLWRNKQHRTNIRGK